jgi:hypothetical protein
VVLREWDPTTLAPDPDAIALRRTFFNASSVLWAGDVVPRAAFVPPLVTISVGGVAEPPRTQVAMQLMAHGVGSYFRTLQGYFTKEGPAELPAAIRLDPNGARAPLSGPHPVLAHTVCAGDADLGSLRIVQSVTRTDVKPFPAPKEFLQKFRVPQQAELRWIELALGELFTPYFATAGGDGPHMIPQAQVPVISVIDGDEMSQPSAELPPPLVEATFDAFNLFDSSLGTTWVSHLDFDRTITLRPGHDYWIHVRNAGVTTFLNRRVRDDESPLFRYGVGPYFARPAADVAWTQAADQVLAFRVVGKPVETLGPTPPPAPVSAAFALSAAPNPAPGLVRVAWSGAVGPVRLEVIDARGRRVSESAGGAAGTWTWAGTDRDGQAVASGIYFLRARDSAGQLSSQRVMIVR